MGDILQVGKRGGGEGEYNIPDLNIFWYRRKIYAICIINKCLILKI